MVRAFTAVIFLILLACEVQTNNYGLGPATGEGPQIVFNPLTKPFAEIPMPNDLALVRNPDTVTGLGWNASLIRPSSHGSRLREHLNEMDGFGTFGPSMVKFDGPLLLETVNENSVRLINIQPGHPKEGQSIPLDLGNGSYPIITEKRAFHGFDIRANEPSLLFSNSNRMDLDGDGQSELVGHYDFEHNRLYIRPLIPLDPQAQYAMILTTEIMGVNGDGLIESIRSPFPEKAHAAQLEGVAHAATLAAIDTVDVAFGWTYTTGSIFAPMRALREGLYGRGPLSKLAEFSSSGFTEVRDTSIKNDEKDEALKSLDHTYILQAQFFTDILGIIAGVQDDDNFNLSFDHVDYLVFGSWYTPNIRVNEERSLSLNLHTGNGEIGQEEVPFMISVPKETETHKAPFPVMLYFHGTGTSRFEPIAVADTMARQGIAVMSFDQVGHGPLILDIPNLLSQDESTAALVNAIVPAIASLLVPERVSEFIGLEFEEALPKLEEVGLFAELAVHGRAYDYNENGVLDVAEAFFFPDPFRLCASFTQDLLDMMQMVKVLRGLRQADVPTMPLENPSEATEETLRPYLLAGDFNADGVLDIGGPNVQLSLGGTSLGGIHATMGAAIEPEIKTVTPIVAGGGLIDLMTRSTLNFILEPLFLEITGNRVVGCPLIHTGYEPSIEGGLNPDRNRLIISQGNQSDRCRKLDQGAVANAPLVRAGTRVKLTNLDGGHSVEATITRRFGFSAGIEADKGDPLELTIYAAGGPPLVYEFPAHQDGTGYERNSDEFRRAVTLQQHLFDRCDPVNYARALFQEPMEGHDTTNVLFLNAIGDTTVPVASTITLARSAGVLGSDPETWQANNQALIETGVIADEYYDFDDILNNNPPEQPKQGPIANIETDTGVSGIRFADVNGKHEWIAGYEKDGFQFGKYSQNQLAIFHVCSGSLIVDDPCIENPECPLLDDPTLLEGCESNLRW
jgi:hypothetical protein